MSKITKDMLYKYKKSKEIVKNSKIEHQKNVNKIIDVVKPIISKNFKGKNWKNYRN